jgi:hypothetical protein
VKYVVFDAAADGGGEEIEEKKKKKVNVRPHLISIEYVVLLLCAGVVLYVAVVLYHSSYR